MRRDEALRWCATHRQAVVVEVLGTAGSVPRTAGTRMLVGADGTLGTIGGGHLELKAIDHARQLLRGGSGERVLRFPLGPALGQCCGGVVTLGFAPLDAAVVAAWPGNTPLFRLQLHGAGHVGRAIATLLATLDCDIDWFDQRDDGFPETTALGSPWPAHVRRTAIDTVEGEVAHGRAGDFYLVLTHEHALDLRIVEAILRRGDAGFVGLIGSATKRAGFERRLRDRGLGEAALRALVCPIGLGGIAGKEPEVIAASVVAQLLLTARPSRAETIRTATRDAHRA